MPKIHEHKTRERERESKNSLQNTYLKLQKAFILSLFLFLFANTVSADCFITSTLKLGSKGAQVSCLQTSLGLTADGSFGSQTKSAVMAFQRANELTADGVAGSQTIVALTSTQPLIPPLSGGLSDATLTSALEEFINLPDIQNKLRGPQGPKGDPGTNGGFAPLAPPSFAPPSSSNNQIIGISGGFASLGVQDLNITTLTVGGNSSLAGNLSVTGSTTFAALTASAGNFTTIGISGSLTSTVATGTAPLVVASTTPVANLSIGGNAATATTASAVTNATLTTALTNNGGAGVLTWPAAGATLTIPTGGGTLGTAAFTASTAYATAAQGSTADAALPSASFTDTAVTGKLITGFSSGAGTVATTDTILQAIQKLNGNTVALVTGVSSVNSLTGAVALTGTANRLTISAANVFDISATFEALLGKVANPLSQFAATTSAELLGVLSDESGTGNILTTNGSAASLTSFPTFNQDTTGNANTVTNGVYTTSDATALAATSAGNRDKYLYSNASTGVLEWATISSSGATTALSNLASVAINTTLVSDTDNTDALGTAAIAWSDLFLGNESVITFNSAPSTSDLTLTHSAETLTFAGGTIALGTATATGGLTGNVTGDVSGNAGTVTNGVYTNTANSFTLINPLTTIAESWIGPSSTAGIYFKGGNVGIGTTVPTAKLDVNGTIKVSGGFAPYLTAADTNCFTNDTVAAYRTEAKTCYGDAVCGWGNTNCTTSYHDWSTTDNTQETCNYAHNNDPGCVNWVCTAPLYRLCNP